MSADWYPGIKTFASHWRHAPMLQQTFEALEREFADENDACIDAAKGFVECACRLLIEELDDPLNPIEKWPDSPIRNARPSFNNWVSAAFRLMAIVERPRRPVQQGNIPALQPDRSARQIPGHRRDSQPRQGRPK